jgi:hypothetical protein
MPKLKAIMPKALIFRDLLAFLWHRKLWWMIPMIVFLVLLGALLIFTQSSAIGPFIYSLF